MLVLKTHPKSSCYAILEQANYLLRDVCDSKQQCTHPLSDALTMYCLSLHALALDRQVMEAVWPNNMALGQIWAEENRGW